VIVEPSTASGSIVVGNANYLTKASGQAVLPASSTSVSISHGLNYLPAINGIQIQQNGQTATPLYVSAVSASSFTVTTATANATGAAFSWVADATQR